MQVYMGGIAPTSLASLRKNTCLAISLAGCDFKCPYCNTPEFLDFKADYLIDILEAKRQINALYGSVDAVIFTGGEPTLQRQALLNLARHCKQIGLKVGIQTNASRPRSILSLLRENILDFIEVDMKSPHDAEKFERITRSKNFFKQTDEIMDEIKETISLLKKNEDSIQIFFKTTIVPDSLDTKEALIDIGLLIDGIKSTWILQGFSPEKTLDKEFWRKNKVAIEELKILKYHLAKKFPKMNIEIAS